MAKAVVAARSLRRPRVTPLATDPVNHLLSRFAFGPTVADRAAVAKLGPDGWFTQQVALAKSHPGYTGNPTVAAAGPLLTLNPYDLAAKMTAQGKQYHWDAMDQLSAVTLGLQAFSSAQLFETLVDFFANHLNVPNHNGDVWNSRPSYDLSVIRRYAMGSFSDMLVASSKHPAMLTYLNLADSTKNTINENYAREVMELHTVGPRYSESDVKNVARMLTGRTLDRFGHYDYDEYIHATGAIKVLGFTHANTTGIGGLVAGDALLRYLAAHPYTAEHLARKLCIRYVSDTPSTTLVNAVAKAYIDNKTQILPMVQTILRSDEFWASRGAKVRRPAENLIATIRILGLHPVDLPGTLNNLQWMTSALGDRPLDWAAPNGYADLAASWRSSGTLLRLWSYQLGLASGWWGGAMGAPDLAAFYNGHTPDTSGEAIDVLTTRLTGAKFGATATAALQAFLNEPASTPMARSSLRWQTGTLIGLILHAPHHAFR